MNECFSTALFPRIPRSNGNRCAAALAWGIGRCRGLRSGAGSSQIGPVKCRPQ